MAENPKYPVSELTFEDKKQLDGIIIKTACEFHSLRQRFPDPKSCAKNMIVKLHSKSLIGLLHTLAYARIDPPDSIFEPGHLNRRITNDTRYTIQSADILTTNGESTHSTHNFLHPRALREEVLKKVVDLKQLVRLKGMKNINVHKHKVKNQRTKTPTNENIEDRGGYPSKYVISEEIVRIRNIAQRTGAADYIRERLNEYGIIPDVIKYAMAVLFHAVKMDKRISPLVFGIGARLMNDNLVESDIHKLETYTQGLQSISDSDLDTLADKAATSLIKYQDTHKLLVHASSLIKLWNI